MHLTRWLSPVMKDRGEVGLCVGGATLKWAALFLSVVG
jgi:hypothetical protein